MGLIPVFIWVIWEAFCGALGIGCWLAIFCGLVWLGDWLTDVATTWSYRNVDAAVEPPKTPANRKRYLSIVEDEKMDDDDSL